MTVDFSAGIVFALYTSKTSQGRWVMVIESGFFYFVLLTLLMVILNVLLTKSQRRHDRHSTV